MAYHRNVRTLCWRMTTMSALNKSIAKNVKLTEEKTGYNYWVSQSAGARLVALEAIKT